MFAIIGRVLGGLAAVGVGLLFVIKSEWFLNNFGAIEWAEQHLGTSGGTRLFYKLIGLGIIFIGFLAATGMIGGFLMGTVGRLFTPPA
ncbi:MAG: hypothetical protein WCT10_04280 [Patescibacteria group bacterium]|jgi:hypothetical protein